MSHATYFIRGCPVCGRRLQIRVVDLGKEVRCRHCRGVFEASEAPNSYVSPHLSEEMLMRKVDSLLSNSDPFSSTD